MSKKHRQKNKPPGRIPTGSTKHNVSPSPSKSRTPDPSSAVEKLNPSDSSLAGAAAQSTTSPHLTQNVSNTDLAEETKTPNSEALVTDVNKRNGKAPIKSLLPIVNQQKMVYKPVDPKASFTPHTTDPQGSKTILQKSQLITTQSPVPDDPLTPRGAPAHQSSCTISTEYDLKEGSLSVDLTYFGDHGGSQKLNNGSSSDISLSEEEDNLDDGSDGI
ncbi:hypothetical protein DY000_02032087 [Brassica cretica]|uniref:Uncharacterized protein n=1 Tax=Brassica cretica TaxID=69181 RepID=A0ABQ7DXJ6_BRACR|nr:hypothetical protein DY000_02032087 [Brassica cretica]